MRTPVDADDKQFEFDPNEYLRPDDGWICGRAAEGAPCAAGPGKNGSCGAVCEPYKIGDRYYCDHAASRAGRCDGGPHDDGSCCFDPPQCVPLKQGRRYVCGRGLCREGPLPAGECCKQIAPCVPVRSTMSRRRIVSFSAFALALGVALAMTGGSNRKMLISPGEVSLHHSAIAENCAACHAAGETDHLVGWVQRAVNNPPRIEQDDRCTTCHDSFGDHPGAPHSMAPAELAAVSEGETTHAGSPSLMLRLARSCANPPSDLACAACHHEHRGSDADLRAMADVQCQVCHRTAFAGFAEGHPEFSDYPCTRRTRIYFDHHSHYGRHFREVARLDLGPEADVFRLEEGPVVQQSCILCHEMDAAGSKMRVRDFAETCAACHAHQIEDDTTPGLPVFSLPVVDTEQLDTARAATWIEPGAAHFAARGQLPDIMRLLLSADDAFTEAQSHVAGLDLADLSQASDEEKQAAEQYLQTLRSALELIKSGGPGEIERRLASALGGRAGKQEVRQLAALIPHEWVAALIERWMPKAEDTSAESPLTDAPASPADVPSGWYLRAADMTLYYRPPGHADPLLKAWLDAAAWWGAGEPAGAPLGDLYRSLSHVAAVGRCLKCHTVDDAAGEGLAVNWQPYAPPPGARPFTKFFHSPHVVMLTDHACLECHVLGESKNSDDGWHAYRPEFVGPDFHVLAASADYCPNFQPVMKSKCVNCHQSGSAIGRCTTCHNYHVK